MLNGFEACGPALGQIFCERERRLLKVAFLRIVGIIDVNHLVLPL
jgi:hypothetical protein